MIENYKDYHYLMELALEQAELAQYKGDVPVGAVVIDSCGQIISKAHNDKENTGRPCNHAEILALNKAGEFQKSWRLQGSTIIVTLEPCPMCLGAMIHARIKTLVFGTYDPKGGALSLGHNLHKDTRLNHSFEVVGGIQHYRCSKMLSEFFKQRRSQHN